MLSKVEKRLRKTGVVIPDAPSPAANYLPFTRTENLVFVSGQVPFIGGKLEITGTVGKNATVEDAQGQAKICAINLLAHLKVASTAIRQSCQSGKTWGICSVGR